MTNLIKSIVVLFLLSMTTFAQTYNWEIADTNLVTAARFDDISFVNPSLGWVANSSGQIYKTTDGGNSWTQQLQISGYFRSIKFADSLNGWAGTLNQTQLLFHTVDGGDHWNLVTNIPTIPVIPKRICGLSVVNKDVIYGSGAYDGPAIIIKTTNGGATWQSIDMSSYATNLIDIYFINKDSGFVVGGSPNAIFNPNNGTTKVVVLYTSNGGSTWSTKYTGQTTPEWGWKIDFPTTLTGYVSIENFNEGSILKTIDGGKTWSKYNVPILKDLEGIGFINETDGWIGTRQTGKNAYAGITNDGGQSWQPDNFGKSLNRFQFFGDSIAYASGITIYKYTKQITTEIKKEDTTPKSFFLSQNYPNPFNPSTTIEYTLPKSENVIVRIYDGLGKELRTILSEFQSAGKHTVKWDGKDANGNIVSSGFYIYRIDAGNNAESKMMLLLK
ncbi:MAG TPA: YCF48-related protein [Ignavibacteriaceae bacterium]|nr:YCF48-related protein [Ignavibacteriaceae bacterium]